MRFTGKSVVVTGGARGIGLAGATRFANEVARASIAAFLASDDASYMAGQTLYPDGGRPALNDAVAVDTASSR